MDREDEIAVYNSACTLLGDLEHARRCLAEHNDRVEEIPVLGQCIARARSQARVLMTTHLLSNPAKCGPLYRELRSAIADVSIDLNAHSFVATAASIDRLIQHVRTLPLFQDVSSDLQVPPYLEYD